MSVAPEAQYENFWNKLLPAYRISQGKMRLPIATELIQIPELNHQELVTELRNLLQHLLDTEATKEKAITRAASVGEQRFASLIDGDYTGIVRFDCVIDAVTSQPRILELNCDYPDGLLMHDHTYSVLSKQLNTLHKDLYKTLFHHQEDVHVLHSPEAVFLDAYHYEHDVLSETENRQISIGHTVPEKDSVTIRRCLETTKMNEEMIGSFSARKTRFVNTFALRTLGYKDLLGHLDHQYIPQTISFSDIDKEIITNNKDTWILKPTNGCEGEGIYFGNQMSQSDWKHTLDQCENQGYVAQEFVTISQKDVSFFDEGTIKHKRLYFDLCPHFFVKKGAVIGHGHTLIRFSESPVVNVSQGGGIGYHRI